MENTITDGAVAGLGEADLEAMLTDVWATIDLPARTAELDPEVASRITAQANLHGDAENLGNELQLVVTIDRDAVALLAGAFYGLDDVSSVSEVQDAVGELANMSAGAVKTLLPGEWVIGIPTVVDPAVADEPGWVSATIAVQGGTVRLALGPGADDDRAA